jgi:hypothetical protein
MPAPWRHRRLLLCLAVICLTHQGSRPPLSGAPQAAGFAARIAALSEAEGYFDTDNLISNERSYLHVLPDLGRLRVRGGAYVGVGPDQNFSYIAAIRPAIAIVVDIRRDNLLLHLAFKALFALSRTRVEYLAMLTGRPVPSDLAAWSQVPVGDLVGYIDRAPPLGAADIDRLRARVSARVSSVGVPLSPQDRDTIDRFHRQFIAAGLDLRFQSAGRAPQRAYPTLRDLLLATDADGRQASYLASEEAFHFLRNLQSRDLLIPIVGDLSGPAALRAVGRFLGERKEPLAAFYTSNVEFYLFRDGSFPAFIGNLSRMPRASNAVIIRSVFGGGVSSSHLQSVSELLDGYAQGGFRQYWQLTR